MSQPDHPTHDDDLDKTLDLGSSRRQGSDDDTIPVEAGVGAPAPIDPESTLAISGSDERTLPLAGAAGAPAVGSGDKLSVGSLIGQKIGVYKVLQKLGEGGMGYVLKGHDQSLNRFVALKLLHPRMARDQAFTAQFKVEAEALAKLNHPNVVNVYSFGSADGLVYFAMQFIRGFELAHMLKEQGQLAPKTMVELMMPVVEGLAYTHSYGILHRDLKPANIMVDEANGRPIVTDFGLARINVDVIKRRIDPEGNFHIDAQDIDENSLVGTPAYMAPELFAPDLYKGEDVQVDVYAMGVIMYQLLTGQLPYPGGNVSEIFENALSRKPRPLGDLMKSPPSPALLRCVSKAMARDPQDRYPSMERLLTDLKEVAREWQQADEVKQRAKMSREMALALSSGGVARGRRSPSLMKPLLTLTMLVLAGIAVTFLMLRGGDDSGGGGRSGSTTAAKNPMGTAETDENWRLGEVSRVYGIVQDIESEPGQTLVTVSDLAAPEGVDRIAVFTLPTGGWQANTRAKNAKADDAICLTGVMTKAIDADGIGEFGAPTSGNWYLPLQELVTRVFDDEDNPVPVKSLKPEHDGQEVGVQGSIVRATRSSTDDGKPSLELEIYQRPPSSEDEEEPPVFTVVFVGRIPKVADRAVRIGDAVDVRGWCEDGGSWVSVEEPEHHSRSRVFATAGQ